MSRVLFGTIQFHINAILAGLHLGGVSNFLLLKALELKPRLRTIRINNLLSVPDYKTSPSDWSASPPLVVGGEEAWRIGVPRARDFSPPNVGPTVGLVR
ncbi:hypothetical protein RUND412_010545 [Rhizina undulata]